MKFLEFVARIGAELFELFEHVESGQPDPEKEKQIAASIIRKASRAQVEKDLG